MAGINLELLKKILGSSATGTGLQTGVGLMSTLLQKRPKSFGDTQYGERLKLLREQGEYSPDMMATVSNSVSSVAGNQAQMNRSQMLGQMLSNGMGGSISATRGLNEINANRDEKISETVRRIKMENEQSKIDAANEYARAATSRSDMLNGFDNNKMQSIFGTIGEGIGNTYESLAEEKLQKLILEYNKKNGG